MLSAEFFFLAQVNQVGSLSGLGNHGKLEEFSLYI